MASVLLCLMLRDKVRRSMKRNHSRILAGLMQSLFALQRASAPPLLGLVAICVSSVSHANNLETAMRAYETGDAISAAVLLKPEAEQGVKEAQLGLGYLYYAGRGVDQNLPLAARWFSAAAENGEAAAMYNLAWLYGTGEGVQANSAKRASWLEKAAEAGFPLAQFEWAQLLERRAHPKDSSVAEAWYEKAAEAGLPAAREKLALAADTSVNEVVVAEVAQEPETFVLKAQEEVAPDPVVPEIVEVTPSEPIEPPALAPQPKVEPQLLAQPQYKDVEIQAIDRSSPVGTPLPPIQKPVPKAPSVPPSVAASKPQTPPEPQGKPQDRKISAAQSEALATPAKEDNPSDGAKKAVAPSVGPANAVVSVSIANMRVAPSTQARTMSRLIRGVELVTHETFAGWTRVTVVAQPQLTGWVSETVYQPIQ